MAMMKLRALAILLSGFAVLGGCGNKGEPQEEDMRTEDRDLRMSESDLRMEEPDLKTDVDMATAAPQLMSLPTCQAADVTTAMFFMNTFKPRCANGECHAQGSAGVNITSADSLRSSWVGKDSKQTMLMPVVKTGGGDDALHSSYIMYKIMGQAAAAMGNTPTRMPKGREMLANSDICSFINWIKGGVK